MRNAVVNILGTIVEFHWSFLLVLMFGAVTGTLLSFWLPICIITVLHEFGHIFAAKWCGVGTRKIIMTPLAGMAEVDTPSTPIKEGIISAGGPLVNVLLIPITYLISENVFFLNLFLLVINMLPIYSLDGGSILRAILWKFMSYSKATYYTVRTGQATMILGLGLCLYLGYTTTLLFYSVYAAMFWIIGENAIKHTVDRPSDLTLEKKLKKFSRSIY